MRTLEFLYFYLMPESAVMSTVSMSNTAVMHRSLNKLNNAYAGHARAHSGDSAGGMDLDIEPDVKTTEDKERMLGQYLNNVADLVHDLRESAPFGVVAA